MKKSVIAAVAASNLTIFSGLVNASDDLGLGSGGETQSCDFEVQEIKNEAGEVIATECYWEITGVLPCNSTGTCQVRGLYPGTWDDIDVVCGVNDSANRVLCDKVDRPQ